MKRTIHIHRLPGRLVWSAATICTCDDPEIMPIGGWWPPSFTCCRLCSRPVLFGGPRW